MSNTPDELDKILVNYEAELLIDWKRGQRDKTKQAIKAYTDKQVQQAVTERDSVWVKTQQIVAEAQLKGDSDDIPGL